MLALRLPPTLEKRLARLAKMTGRTKSFYAREAILRHLEDIEDSHLAHRRLNSRAQRVKLEALENEFLTLKPGDVLRFQVTKAGIILEKASGVKNDHFSNFVEWSGAADKKTFHRL